MATLIMDMVEGASLETGGGQPALPSQRIRTGRIRGINVSGSLTTPDPHVLEKALTLLPAINSTYPAPPGGSGATEIANLRLVKHVLKPFNYNTINVALVYRTDAFEGELLSSYLLTDSSRLVRERTNMLPGTRFPLALSWESQTDSNDKVPEDLLTIEYEKAFRVIRIAQIIYSAPPTAQRESLGRVNDAAYYGYPIGYWRVDGYETTNNIKTGQRQVLAEMASRVDEDWSTYGILVNRHTGKYVKVDPSTTAALVADDYIYGTTTILVSGKETGVMKVGPHKLADFTSIFGTLPT
jgi:hypothetical protein